MTGVRIDAPAKVNLGLAVLRKRGDGYHDIDTIMAMINLADTITIRSSPQPGITIHGMAEVDTASNLITHAIGAWCARANVSPAYDVHVTKRIPSSAGLGGGSSDAAATIRALNRLHGEMLSNADLHELATTLGADCAFFLGTPAARATGIGDQLIPIEPPSGAIVIVVPPAAIADKTARMYGALTPGDYLGSEHIDAIQGQLRSGTRPDLVNSFTRCAQDLVPAIEVAADALVRVAGTWSLSGAGPAIYALANSEATARSWHNALRVLLPQGFAVIVSRFIGLRPKPVTLP